MYAGLLSMHAGYYAIYWYWRAWYYSTMQDSVTCMQVYTMSTVWCYASTTCSRFSPLCRCGTFILCTGTYSLVDRESNRDRVLVLVLDKYLYLKCTSNIHTYCYEYHDLTQYIFSTSKFRKWVSLFFVFASLLEHSALVLSLRIANSYW